MKITIRSKKIKLNKALEEFIEEKIGSLDKFLGKSQVSGYRRVLAKFKKPSVKARVEIEKTTQHHKKGPYFRAEGQLYLGGKSVSIRAESKNEDLRQAIVEVKDELQRELKKYKEKRSDKTKRKQRFLKKIFRLARGAKFKKRPPKEE